MGISLVFAAFSLNGWLLHRHSKNLKWNKAASHMAEAFPTMVDWSIFFPHPVHVIFISEPYSCCHCLLLTILIVKNLLPWHPIIFLDSKLATL